MSTKLGLVLLACLGLDGCYSSSGDDRDADAVADRAEDATGDTVTDTPSDPGADADAPLDATPDEGTVCLPPEPMPLRLEFTVDGASRADADIDVPCRVTSVVNDESGHHIIALECGTGGMMETHTIDLAAEPDVWPGVFAGEEVTFRYLADTIWWVNRWLAIRTTGGFTRLALVEADSIAPPGMTPAEWYGGYAVRVLSGVCTPVTDSCGPLERQGIEVTFGGTTGVVFDGGRTSIGGMAAIDVLVLRATHYLSMGCDDVPDQFYTATFSVIPEG
jgi:hypothetical protein